MRPKTDLPLSKEFTDDESYVESLLEFSTSSTLLQTLCGGVHILDFFTRTPDLYSCILPEEWRNWFRLFEIEDILDLLLREDLTQFLNPSPPQEWRSGPAPPHSLIAYIHSVRRHLLSRSFHPPASPPKLDHLTTIGMTAKKIHEVSHVAHFVSTLTSSLAAAHQPITHLIDFGSGHNYLGRALASPPYHENIIAVESRPHVVAGAREIDIMAGLAEKPVVRRNKKAYRAARAAGTVPDWEKDKARFAPPAAASSATEGPQRARLETPPAGRGSVQYVEHRIQDGNLAAVIEQIAPAADAATTPALMTISLHSCGNLSHHALRTLSLNPAVRAVAVIGCCYNLLTERLGPSFKTPGLRHNHPRLSATNSAFDPHGFPMSARFATYIPPGGGEEGIRLNITARMMAVQAPRNWTKDSSEAFFTRHFYRALLQRVFLEKGIVEAPRGEGGGTYARGAVEKIAGQGVGEGCSEEVKAMVAERVGTMTSDEVVGYGERFRERRKELSVVWSLMAVSAGVAEALVVVDRWTWLREQEGVKEAWVQPVFEYGESPRNLVVVGIKG
ncbi:hypothetical protein EJ06DRAFT_520003 [Trichodelitschia bisporula]|uniref:Methyltransferase domain-containing protein n=1 Tax=Trichodelitschia bisporula TaxID=703511 RepID=A0A6G1I412_9PEZI|nr:hypothetical protein EJ06DRAFT_520003 [Trichodelitschia bisporula]